MKNNLMPEDLELIRQRTAEAAEFRKLEADVIVAKLIDAAPQLAPKIKAVLEGGAK